MDAFFDTLKLLPFLFVTYLVMEWLEKKTEKQQGIIVTSSRKFGPALGGLFGVIPQCGFSLVAANFYTGGMITVGVLVAVFMSTSDEMLPIMISSAVGASTILKILGAKVVIAIVTGYAVDMLHKKISPAKVELEMHIHEDDHHHHHHDDHDHEHHEHNHSQGHNHEEKHIHDLCVQEHCRCDEGIFISAIKHTLKIALFIFIISFVLDIVMTRVGAEALSNFLGSATILSIIFAAIVGIVPNCAASVVITELYIAQVISAGAMMAGLLMSAGVGLLVLFRMNKFRLKENIKILATIFAASIFWGIIIDLIGLTF